MTGEPFQTKRLNPAAKPLAASPWANAPIPTISERHRTQQPDRKRNETEGGNATITIVDCDGAPDKTLTFVNGVLQESESMTIYSGCGGGGGGGST